MSDQEVWENLGLNGSLTYVAWVLVEVSERGKPDTGSGCKAVV